MARSFTKDEASELIRFHKDLLDKLSDIIEENNRYLNETKQLSDKISSSCSFDANVMQYISEQNISDRTNNSMNLVRSVYLVTVMQPVVSSTNKLLNEYRAEILLLIDTLKRGKGSIRWLFLSAKHKEDITQAFEKLKAKSQSEYVTAVQETIEKAAIIRNINDDVVWDNFSDDEKKKWYRSVFSKKLNGYTSPRISEFASLIDDFENIAELINKVESRGSGIEEMIKEAAMKLAKKESLKALADISIEEVSRESKGIRIKALKDAGYSTILDIYIAPVYALEAINGISENRAFEIKRIAEKIAQSSYEGAKIQLSIDNKTPEATRVISLIYSFRTYEESTKELHEYISKHQDKIKMAIQTLSGLGNSINWLFYTAKEKDDIANSFRYLKQIKLSGYIDNVRDIISRIVPSDRVFDNNDAWTDFEQNSIQYYNVLERLLPGMLGNQDLLYGLPEVLAKDIQEQAFFTEGLLCTLRNYQMWGVRYILHQERVLLGDEMGLGKTVQAIAAMVSLCNTKETHFVVVCPASVLTNWCREIGKHSKLRVVKVYGSNRISSLTYWKKNGGVAVTTYETTGYFTLEDDFRFGMAIIDEAHYIKNPSARRTINVKRICQHTERLLLMTGTALENRVDEMISLIDILRPKIAKNISRIAYLSTAPQFRDEIAPVYFRRKREDVLTELPELIESEEWCDMTPEEIMIYEDDVRDRQFNAMRRVSWNVSDLEKSSKAQRMNELITEAEAENRKVLVFSFFRDNIKKICMMLGSKCLGPITGSVTSAQRQNIIDEFERAPTGTVLVSQIQAGGTGLNIQSASVVILCEPQVKPSIENQAISRAYRMGQTRNVLVYKLLCNDSVDERMMEILSEKQQAFDAFADESVAAMEDVELDSASVTQIINDEIERINAKKKTLSTTISRGVPPPTSKKITDITGYP